MNQIRRKKSFAERPQRSSVSRFFRPAENSEKRGKGIPETKESEEKPEDKENIGPETGKPFKQNNPIVVEIAAGYAVGQVRPARSLWLAVI